jgi:phosphotransferase system HPr-like phosphotransfer protein
VTRFRTYVMAAAAAVILAAVGLHARPTRALSCRTEAIAIERYDVTVDLSIWDETVRYKETFRVVAADAR